MRINTVAEILEMDDGKPIDAFKGKVSRVYERSSGGSGDKAWVKQDLECQDVTGKIKVTLWGREAFPKTIIGQQIYIAQTKSTRGWTGVKASDFTNKKTNVTTRSITVTEAAELIIGEGEPASQEQVNTDPRRAAADATSAAAPAEPNDDVAKAKAMLAAAEKKAAEERKAREDAAKAPPKAASAPAAQNRESAMENVTECRKFIARRANLYELCVGAGLHVVKRVAETKEHIMTDDQFQAMVSALFIASARAGIAAGLPTGCLDNYMPEKKAAPAPANDGGNS